MGSSSKAPQPYTPTGQASADAGYQNLVNGATPYATALPGQVIPGLNQVVSNVQNDPYFTQQMQGAQDVSSLATGTVAPAMGQAASNLYNSAGATAASGASALTNGQDLSAWANSMIPQATQGGMTNAQTAWDESQQAIPALTGGMGAANQLLMNGFDPQNALYDRNYQQMQDQQNALNSQYGVSGSAYGAGVAGTASRNFNLDWQNNQLSRQLAALQGYGQQQGQVTNDLTSLLNTGGNQYNSLMNGAVSRGSDLAALSSNAMNSGVSTNANAQQAAAGLYGQASANGTDMLNTMATATALPNSTYMSNQDAQIAALQALAQGGGMSLAPTSSMIGAEGNYLQLGQSATSLSQNAASINNAAQAAQMSALASGLGTIAGIALAPATGGLSLFGSGASKTAGSSLGSQMTGNWSSLVGG